MGNHPYWAYVVVSGVLDVETEEKALAEGRRLAALELATRESDTDEGHLNRAVRFEAYLKGEAPVTPVETTEYENLVERASELIRLEAAGVDNWEGYYRG